MNITYVYPEDPSAWVATEWRCRVPQRAINRTGKHRACLMGVRDFCQGSPRTNAILEQSDVIVFHRNLWGRSLSVIQHWRARDKTVIADFDEAYNLLENGDKEYHFWTEGNLSNSDSNEENISPSPITQFKWGLQLVNGVTVPSKCLVDDWQSFTNIELLASYIDVEKYLDILPENHDETILGWNGSSTQLRDFSTSGALEAIKEVCKARPKVRIFLYCDDIDGCSEMGLPESQTVIKSRNATSSWPRPLAKFDIGLVPYNRPFSQRSSWAPLLEYMVMKIPWLASQGPAYHDLQPYGYLVRNSMDDWKNRIIDAVDHLSDYKAEASGEPYLLGISQSIDENVYRVVGTYTRIAEYSTGKI